MMIFASYSRLSVLYRVSNDSARRSFEVLADLDKLHQFVRL